MALAVRLSSLRNWHILLRQGVLKKNFLKCLRCVEYKGLGNNGVIAETLSSSEHYFHHFILCLLCIAMLTLVKRSGVLLFCIGTPTDKCKFGIVNYYLSCSCLKRTK